MNYSKTRHPIEISNCTSANDENVLHIKWSDGSESFFSGHFLRLNCPCATCLETRGASSHDSPLTAKSQPAPVGRARLLTVEKDISESLKLLEISGVGNYAIGLSWADGHSTGIYSFSYLEKLDC